MSVHYVHARGGSCTGLHECGAMGPIPGTNLPGSWLQQLRKNHVLPGGVPTCDAHPGHTHTPWKHSSLHDKVGGTGATLARKLFMSNIQYVAGKVTRALALRSQERASFPVGFVDADRGSSVMVLRGLPFVSSHVVAEFQGF